MKFKKYNSQHVANVVITKYLIDWERKVSLPQYKTKAFLRSFWEGCCVLEEFLIPGSKMRIDLLNITGKVAIEISPESSHDFNKFFHKSRVGFLAALKRDDNKRIWSEQNGFTHIELNSADIKNLSKELLEQKGLIL